MSDINFNSVKTVNMREIKLLDEFLKIYHNTDILDEQAKKTAVINAFNGNLDEEMYNGYIEKLKLYTKNGTVPSVSDWAEIRALFRDYGNERIRQAKEDLETSCKNYSGKATIESTNGKMLSPKQVVDLAQYGERRVRFISDLKIIVSIILGTIGFLGVIIGCRVLFQELLTGIGMAARHIIGGVASIVGLSAGAFLGIKLMGVMEKALKKVRNEAEILATMHHEYIVELQSKIQAAQETVKKIESQYEVEILAQTDFSRQLKREQKEEKKHNASGSKPAENNEE